MPPSFIGDHLVCGGLGSHGSIVIQANYTPSGTFHAFISMTSCPVLLKMV